MKILNIMLSRGKGGIEQAFIDYSRALELQGHEVINITSAFAKINNIVQNSIKLPNLGNLDLISKICLNFLIKTLKPDAIICHGRRSIKFASSCKNIVIGVAHNYNINDLIKCKYIIALTSHMKNFLVSQNFPAERIALIPNMIDINEPFQFRPFHKKVRIGVCARFVAKKGIDIFLQGLNRLKEDGYLFEGVIAGDGEEKDNLIKLCGQLNLTNKVKFTGWITDKKAFFNSIDIFCLPSLHEPFGIVLLEAMHYGTPVISTKTEGPIEILSDEKTALLIEKNSPEELKTALALLIDNPKMAAAQAKNAYNIVKDNYSIQIVAAKLTNFLKTYL